MNEYSGWRHSGFDGHSKLSSVEVMTGDYEDTKLMYLCSSRPRKCCT